jgi:hypothetical protein
MKKNDTTKMQVALFEAIFQSMYLKYKKRYGIKKALEETGAALCILGIEEAFTVEMFKIKLHVKYSLVIEDCIKKGYNETKELFDKYGKHITTLN